MNYFWQLDQGSGFGNIGTNSSMLGLCDSINALDSAMVRCIITDINGDSAISVSAMISVDSCLPPVADFDFYFDFTEVIACYTSTSERAETLIWLFGDGNTSSNNVADTCHDYEDKELYYVKLYAFNSYGVDSITKKVDILGIDETDAQFELYPNPVSDMMVLSGESLIDQVTVYNALGKISRQFTVRAKRANLDLSTLRPGAYFIRIESDGGVQHRTILKQ